VALGVQIALVFTALNVLYFFLAVRVEKSTFGDQITLITQSIMDDLKPQLAPLLYQPTPADRDEINVAVAGLMDTLEEKISLGARAANASVDKHNAEVKKNAWMLLLRVVAIIGAVVLVLILVGFCADWMHSLKEAGWAVLFVAITEIMFLYAVTARYVSADPNLVKRQVGTTVHKWIQNAINSGKIKTT
jgi:ABC-type iron transport system FetAB permease component